MIDGTMLTLRIDPHRVRDGNLLTTRLAHAVGAFVIEPEPGEWVRGIDDEGNTLLGLVVGVTSGRVEMKIDWTTFSPAPPVFLMTPTFGVLPEAVASGDTLTLGSTP